MLALLNWLRLVDGPFGHLIFSHTSQEGFECTKNEEISNLVPLPKKVPNHSPEQKFENLVNWQMQEIQIFCSDD